jgi:hypothetical protein
MLGNPNELMVCGHFGNTATRLGVTKSRLLSESIALAEVSVSTATLAEGFMHKIEEGIASRSQPWDPWAWE